MLREEKIAWFEDTLVKKTHGRFLSMRPKIYKFLEENELFDLLERAKVSKSLQFLKQELYNWAYEEIPVCKTCGKPVKFSRCLAKYLTYCSAKCSNSNEEVKQKKKETCLRLFGAENAFQSTEKKEKIKQTCLERYGVDNPAKVKEVQKKIQETCVIKYGVPNALQCSKIKQKSKETSRRKYGTDHPYQNKEVQEKYKQTCLKRYGVDNPAKSEVCRNKTKQTCMERYGVDCYVHSQKFKENVHNMMARQYQTKKKHNTFVTSGPEEKIFEQLKEKFPNVQRNFKSEAYPFTCDFYVPELDLYIEFQGHWTHGKEPFDLENPEHQRIIEKWTQKASEYNFKNQSKNMYRNALKICTVSDVKKRNWAKEHNLNWLEFFTLDQFNAWVETQI